MPYIPLKNKNIGSFLLSLKIKRKSNNHDNLIKSNKFLTLFLPRNFIHLFIYTYFIQIQISLYTYFQKHAFILLTLLFHYCRYTQSPHSVPTYISNENSRSIRSSSSNRSMGFTLLLFLFTLLLLLFLYTRLLSI